MARLPRPKGVGSCDVRCACGFGRGCFGGLCTAVKCLSCGIAADRRGLWWLERIQTCYPTLSHLGLCGSCWNPPWNPPASSFFLNASQSGQLDGCTHLHAAAGNSKQLGARAHGRQCFIASIHGPPCFITCRSKQNNTHILLRNNNHGQGGHVLIPLSRRSRAARSHRARGLPRYS